MYNNSLDSKTLGWTLAVVFGVTTFGLAGISLKQNKIISKMKEQKEHSSWVLGQIYGRLEQIDEEAKRKEDEEAE